MRPSKKRPYFANLRLSDVKKLHLNICCSTFIEFGKIYSIHSYHIVLSSSSELKAKQLMWDNIWGSAKKTILQRNVLIFASLLFISPSI